MPEGPPRDITGKFLPIILTPEEEVTRQERQDENGLVKFSDVLNSLATVPNSDAAVEDIRGKILFQGNPKVRIKVALSPGNVSLGIGPSVQRRLGADFALPPIASTKAKVLAIPTKKKRPSQKLVR